MSEKKIDYLPSLSEVYDPLDPAQIAILKHQVEVEGGDSASSQTRFNYGWGLVKSNDKEDQRLGITILASIYKDSPNRRRECLYYLALGCCRAGEYSEAHRYIEALYSHEPTNRQVISLKNAIEEKIKEEAWRGGLAIGATAAVGLAALAAYISRRRRK
ncbi:hypothetical protein TBLA_0C04730 [Henningerozyma blattae CBS 6284]|uniref:Mitochondrial fission 1 protein n=1 Tax=Henningerozyma blattae (strain ATCC 34711 / CBS 6284 / DSM 70876 / NBRC 10599 / NRRL Y-10934 / UCD 77-7) TaxID=1071380 RepID=I2H1L7_HENB6|nr:hypothetical protein TBLA_0C04730 [Tetrapisispora blattae CBS 6284]CCH60269.1 hypothetical protein TBLA_0C04730 [Tetrapisispora blattae CBS 6284]